MKIPRRRRSIEHDVPNRFMGWDYILELYRKARELDVEKETNQHALYFVTVFETGGRRSEVVKLKPQQIRWNNEVIIVENMEVLKRRRRYSRDVIIRYENNPLASALIKFVEDCETEYLLPARARFTSAIIPDRHISTSTLYNIITAIDPNIFPHWLRDQRSWHLSAKLEDGGDNMDSYLLRAWFEWASMDMPAHYAGRRELKDILDHYGVVEPL